MPYIKSGDGRREALQKGDIAQSAGELNYQIFYYVKHNITSKEVEVMPERCFLIIKGFIHQFLGEKPNYQKYNDMTGALVRCSVEVERRLSLNLYMFLLNDIMGSYTKEINDYEDIKINENGDVE
jgi:hypothetical protein